MKNRIKELIFEMGITQKELAEKTGMTEAGISRAIAGSASKRTIERIASILNVEPKSLLVEEDMPYAQYGSEKTPLTIGNIEVPCYVLNTGERVLSGRGIQKVLGSTSNSGEWLQRFSKNAILYPFFVNEEMNIIERIETPIVFRRNDAGGSQSNTYGYEATLLIDICSAILDAAHAGVYNDAQIIASADAIIRAVAKVGIIALIDEATGYNKEKNRAKDELQQFLNSFLSAEASRWVKVFDDSFFEDLYKMHNWSWSKASKKPGVVGTWINDIVYQRLGPMVLEELRSRNPADERGIRKHKHHQYLTGDIGIPALKNHLVSLHSLAVASKYNWPLFMRFVDTVHPRQVQQMYLFENNEDIDL